MARRIACYVIFIALIWGATAEREENIRNLFKSNMTRGDFSNLLKSLIRLNEQRVNVLQKLSRLEDYSMLSEVLRSGDKKGDGNLSNLFLVVLSKSALDGKNIFRNHRTSVDDDDIRVANDRNEQKLADDNRSERLGLLILDHNRFTRRSFDIGGNSKESNLQDDDDEKKVNEEGIEPRGHGKKNKKKHHEKKRIGDKRNNLRMRGEETVENTQVPNAECLLETQQDVEKCIISCRRVQEDVCGQLNCSTRSQKALHKECSYNCRKIFDVNICY